jgi:hypothetical protein
VEGCLLKRDAPSALVLARLRDRLPLEATFYSGKWRIEVERTPRSFSWHERVKAAESCEGLFYS